jgi:tetratricopeptide (TPR) repeat protein
MQFCQSGLSLAISIGSTKRQSLALHRLAWAKFNTGDFGGAQKDAFASQRAAKIAGNLLAEATALYVEACCWQFLGHYSHCICLLDPAILLLNLCGMSQGSAYFAIRTCQADIHHYKSEYGEASNIQTDILQNNSVDQNPFDYAVLLLNIAQTDIETGATEHSVQQKINTAGALFQKINSSAGLGICDQTRAALDVQQGNFLAAQSSFQSCLTLLWGKNIEAEAYCLEKLGTIQQWSHGDQIGCPWIVTFLVHSVKYKLRLGLHKALQFLGNVFKAQGDQETATTLFTVALDGFTQMDVHRSRAECMVGLGDIAKQNGDKLTAVKLLETARPLFQRSLQGKQLVHLEAKLAGLNQEQLQEAQLETLDCLSGIHTPTEHLEQLSCGAIQGIEGMGLEEKSTHVLRNT